MKKTKLNSQGITHYMLLIGVVVIAAIVGIFLEVNNANKHNPAKANSQNASSSSQVNGKTDVTDKTQQPAVSVSGSSSSSSSKTSPLVKSSSSSSKPSPSSSSSSSSTQPSSNPSSTPPTYAQELSALTTIITALNNGSTANVTASTVTVAGPINDATAQPIVFSVNGQSFFAYRQESAPNFNQSASATAGQMAITSASGSPVLTQAYLDKSGELVDSSYQLVGYSTGGDSGGK